MKMKDILSLEPGSVVVHRRYGLCKVDEVMTSLGSFFGITLSLLEQKGKDILADDSDGALSSGDVLFLKVI